MNGLVNPITQQFEERDRLTPFERLAALVQRKAPLYLKAGGIRGYASEYKGRVTPEEEALILELRKADVKLKDIAVRVGRGQPTVSTVLRKHGYRDVRNRHAIELRTKIAALMAQNRNANEIAAELGSPLSTVWNHISAIKKGWKPKP